MSDDTPLGDDQIESLISGSATPTGHEDVAALFRRLRASGHQGVRVGPSLSEFVSGAAQPPTRPPTVDDIWLEPVAADSDDTAERPRRLLRSPLLHGVAALAVVVAGVGGAHAAGVLDVPFLPDDDDPVEVVFAESPEPPTPTEAAPPAPADELQDPPPPLEEVTVAEPEITVSTAPEGEMSLTLTVAGVSATITITFDASGDHAVGIDVEGVSPECEAAIEAIDPTDDGGFDAAVEAVRRACRTELEAVEPLIGDAEALGRLLEGVDIHLELPESLRERIDELRDHLAELDLEGLEGLDLGHLQGLDLSELLEDFSHGLDLEDLDLPNLDLDGLEGHEGFERGLRELLEGELGLLEQLRERLEAEPAD